MQKARSHPNKLGLLPLVSVRFQVLFTPFHRVLFTFPSQYWFTIGLTGIFSLSGWCRQIQTRFHRPRLTQDTDIIFNCTCTGLSPSSVIFSNNVPILLKYKCFSPTTPNNRSYLVWAVPRSLATTCGIIVYFLFLRVLRCFSSPGYLSLRSIQSSTIWVAPFGHLWIKGYLHLPIAFRSLSRPSQSL